MEWKHGYCYYLLSLIYLFNSQNKLNFYFYTKVCDQYLQVFAEALQSITSNSPRKRTTTQQQQQRPEICVLETLAAVSKPARRQNLL